jgi:hypothetical protein
LPTILIYWILLSPLLIVFILLIYSKIHNGSSLKATNNFLEKIKDKNFIILRQVKLQYWERSEYRSYISPNNECDLYLMEDSIALVRRQIFFVTVHFRPIIITANISDLTKEFRDLYICRPTKIFFKEVITNEIEIIIPSSIGNYYWVEITLKRLTQEQKNRLNYIKNWLGKLN